VQKPLMEWKVASWRMKRCWRIAESEARMPTTCGWSLLLGGLGERASSKRRVRLRSLRRKEWRAADSSRRACVRPGHMRTWSVVVAGFERRVARTEGRADETVLRRI
jgi:hypothetical protein